MQVLPVFSIHIEDERSPCAWQTGSPFNCCQSHNLRAACHVDGSVFAGFFVNCLKDRDYVLGEKALDGVGGNVNAKISQCFFQDDGAALHALRDEKMNFFCFCARFSGSKVVGESLGGNQADVMSISGKWQHACLCRLSVALLLTCRWSGRKGSFSFGRGKGGASFTDRNRRTLKFGDCEAAEENLLAIFPLTFCAPISGKKGKRWAGAGQGRMGCQAETR